MRTIVVGTDGSKSSLKAVEQAAQLASATGGTLHIACAVPNAADITAFASVAIAIPGGWDEQAFTEAAAAVDRAAEVASQHGTDAKRHVLRGEASDALIDLTNEVGADVLVVGSKGMTGASRFLLGSVPNRCAHHAHCSVLVVRTT